MGHVAQHPVLKVQHSKSRDLVPGSELRSQALVGARYSRLVAWISVQSQGWRCVPGLSVGVPDQCNRF